MSGSSLSPNAAAIVVGIIQVVGSCLASSLVEGAGRRPLLLVSCAGMILCHCVIGTFCYFQELGYDVAAYAWVPVVALSVFMVVYTLGMGAVPIIVTAEIFSREMFTMAGTISLICLWISAFTMVKIFADLIALLGMYGCFFLLAALCASSFLFCLVLVPETKGRLREDIVDELSGKRCAKSEKNAKHIVGTPSAQAAHV